MPSYMYKHPPLSPDIRQADRPREASVSPHHFYPPLISPAALSPDIPRPTNRSTRPASPVGASIGTHIGSFHPAKLPYPPLSADSIPLLQPPHLLLSQTPPSSPEKSSVQSSMYYNANLSIALPHTPPISPENPPSPYVDERPQDYTMRSLCKNELPKDYSMRECSQLSELTCSMGISNAHPRSPLYATKACSSMPTESVSTLPSSSASTDPISHALPLIIPPARPAISTNPLIFPVPPRPSSVCSSIDDDVSVVSTSSSFEKHQRQPKDQTFQDGVTVGYTYDAFFITDGRSRKKKPNIIPEKVRQRYSCSECGKNYATSSNLSRHKQTHRSLDSQLAKKCPHCTKVYVSMPALSMHILTHNLNHQCPVCNKSFSRPWLLQGHMRSHTGQKPYGCAHCGKAFADRSNLRAHMQTHSTFKHYTCDRCDKSFALKSYLNKHYESACFKDCAEIPQIHSPSIPSPQPHLSQIPLSQTSTPHHYARLPPDEPEIPLPQTSTPQHYASLSPDEPELDVIS